MLVLSAADEGLTSSAKGSRRFERHRVFPRGGKQSPVFGPCSRWHLEHLSGVLEHRRCAELLTSASKAAKSHPRPPPPALRALRERWSSDKALPAPGSQIRNTAELCKHRSKPRAGSGGELFQLLHPPRGPSCHLHRAEVPQGSLTALPELPGSLAGATVLGPGAAGLSERTTVGSWSPRMGSHPMGK